MKELLVALLIFGVIAFSLINLNSKEAVKEVNEVPRIVVKERVVVKEIVKKPQIVYRTVNHYHRYRTVAYYQLPEQPRVQRVSYNYYEPVKEQPEYKEKQKAVALAPKAEERSEVKMFLVEGIRQPLWVKGGKK